MKLLLIIMAVFFYSDLFADQCSNLSHVYKLGAGVIHFKQLNCNTIERETYLNGESMGDKTLLQISDIWNIIKVDDDYEVYTNQQRWMWNKDKSKIIHEYVVDTITKSDSSRDFRSGSDIYELADQNVKKSSVFLSRKENSEGRIEIKADNKMEQLEKLD
ncbi:MAG: hypothetical protein HUU56_17375 [Bdellovibrionaceae bacterium]|nr:hypothetical protein [Pseudobdellovibrionaceae bacterium]